MRMTLETLQRVGLTLSPSTLLHQLICFNVTDLRHTCEQDEGMAGYGWTAYDVRKGGVQFFNDTENAIDLITQFVKVSNEEESGTWGLRVRGIPNAGSHQKTTVIFYLGVEDPKSRISCKGGETSNTSGSNAICVGTTTGLGDFSVQIAHYRGESSRHMAIKSLTVPKDTIWQAKPTFNDQFKDKINHKGMLVDDPGEGNLHFVQQSFEGEFEFDVLYSSGQSSDAMTSSTLESGVQDASSEFNKRFQSVYSPQTPFGDEQYTMFSQALLSNLMGGIGYFYGTSKVDKSSTLEYAETDNIFWEAAAAARSHTVIEEQGPHQLFSAVPSRPFFPRGFLWDEGFHLEVILNWDMDLALEILSSWFDLMDEKGWIAREQILGPEARSKVPPEFQTQYLHYANPPTLFLVVEAFVARLSGASDYSGAPSHYLSDGAAGKKFVKAIYPKMRKHFEWFCETQKGNLKHYQHAGSQFKQGYRWQGRTPRHTLTSGLDDYPRAQPPGPEELHVDALSWVGSMAIALGRVAAFLEEEGDKEKFLKQEIEVIQSLDNIHWSEHNRAYCDATIVDGTRVEKVCHKGYVSLFPFLVGLMSSDHSRLGAVLDLIRNPEELWSSHGIRSLSLKDIFYGTDENYWRSPVWININYMVIRRLLVSAVISMPFYLYFR